MFVSNENVYKVERKQIRMWPKRRAKFTLIKTFFFFKKLCADWTSYKFFAISECNHAQQLLGNVLRSTEYTSSVIFLGTKLYLGTSYLVQKMENGTPLFCRVYIRLPNQHHGMHLHDVRRPLFDVFGVVLLSLSQKLVSLWLIHQSVSPLGATFSCFGPRVKCRVDNGFMISLLKLKGSLLYISEGFHL